MSIPTSQKDALLAELLGELMKVHDEIMRISPSIEDQIDNAVAQGKAKISIHAQTQARSCEQRIREAVQSSIGDAVIALNDAAAVHRAAAHQASSRLVRTVILSLASSSIGGALGFYLARLIFLY